MPSDDDAFRIERMHLGSFAQAEDGHVHRKVIPFAIVVQPTQGWYEVAGLRGTVRVETGEIAVVAADTPVSFAHHRRGGRMAARWLHVQATWRELVDPVALVVTPARIAGADAQRIGDLLDALHAADGDATMPGRLRRIALAYHVLAESLACAQPDADAARMVAAASRLGPLVAWMRANLHRPLEIENLSRAARLSRSRLHALFHEHLRRTPMRVLMELRLAQAARLLLTTDVQVAEVADAVGFVDAFHFSRCFSRRYGLSPRRYRGEQSLRFGGSGG